MGRFDKWLVVSAALGLAAAAMASETITYTYDARGRLTKVARSGTVNSGVSTSYSYDKADNRTNRTTTGVVGTTAAASPIQEAAAVGSEPAASPPLTEEPQAPEPAPESPGTDTAFEASTR